MPAPARVLELAGADVQIYPDPAAACHAAADRIARTLRESVAGRGRAVLGMATGGTPIPIYERLVALHRAGEVSFRDATTYNLDEYYPISPLDPNSYRAYMHRHLFAHVDIQAHRAHLLDGTVPEPFAAGHCDEFERWIAADGGLDLQLLGIGRNAHIGFNEPSEMSVDEALSLPTRPVELHPVTRADAVRDFGGDPEAVPRRALSMGIASILAARSVVIVAYGPHKAEAVAASLTGPVTASVPASLLQTIPGRVTWLIDEPAAASLG